MATAVDDNSNARVAGAAALAEALRDARRDTLTLFHALRAVLPDLRVPLRPTLNPPLWELGHVGWFQEAWTSRNPAWREGVRADPTIARRPGVRADADLLYDSSEVPHDTRWDLPLPGVEETLDDLARQLDATLALLARVTDDEDDDALYFFRLALFHEDMHREAAACMAQSLDLRLPTAPWTRGPRPRGPHGAPIQVPGGPHAIGTRGPGFAFDNELAAHEVVLAPFVIDAAPVTWAELLPWLEESGAAWPRFLQRQGGAWHVRRFGRTIALDLDEPACHLTRPEAEAWCEWAGRRLPTEFEWEAAAAHAPDRFAWGQVWEWTASPFAPWPGFVPHPYRDYSAPWFDGRPVLKGASFATSPRTADRRYRNFFPADRGDVFAGFRTCAA